MRLPLVLSLVYALSTLPALAGAWLEAEGRGFTSSALRARGSGQEVSGYLAYGVSQRLTFGLDFNQSTDAQSQSAHALVFARLPLRQSETGWQLAFGVAAGLGRVDTQWSGMKRISLSAGRKLAWPKRGAWVNFDLTREWREEGLTKAWKLDGAFGFERRSGPAVIFRGEIFQPDAGARIWKVLPGLRWRLSPKRELLTGLEWRSFGQERLGLTLEVWQRF